MFINPKIVVAGFAAALFLFAGASEILADTIKLKDGSVIKGKIVEYKNQQITVVRTNANNRTAQVTLDADEIESIEFDSFAGFAALVNDSRRDAGNSAQTETRANNNQSAAPQNGNERAANTAAQNVIRDEPATTTTDVGSAPNSTVSQNPVASATEPNRQTAARTNNGGLSQVINSQPIQPSVNRPSNSNNSNNNIGFVPLAVKVLADNTANGWTNTGLVVKKGQRLRISANGRISLGSGNYTTPAGVGAIADDGRLMKTEPTGALIAVIGDDNNDFVFVGASREFTAERDGTLFLGVNESNLDDNSGVFDAVVEAEANVAIVDRR